MMYFLSLPSQSTSKVIYWLLRSLDLSPVEAVAARTLYCINDTSIALVNIKDGRAMSVIAVGDSNHLSMFA